jgi:hypothetical protein
MLPVVNPKILMNPFEHFHQTNAEIIRYANFLSVFAVFVVKLQSDLQFSVITYIFCLFEKGIFTRYITLNQALIIKE